MLVALFNGYAAELQCLLQWSALESTGILIIIRSGSEGGEDSRKRRKLHWGGGESSEGFLPYLLVYNISVSLIFVRISCSRPKRFMRGAVVHRVHIQESHTKTLALRVMYSYSYSG